MLNANVMALFRSYGILAARILLGGMFALAGLDKLLNSEGTAAYIASVGLPENTLLALAVGLFEVVAGLAIVFGKKTAEAALALALFVIIASFLFHGPGLWSDAPMQKILFTKNAAILAALLYMVAYGAGNAQKLDRNEV